VKKAIRRYLCSLFAVDIAINYLDICEHIQLSFLAEQKCPSLLSELSAN